MGRMMSEDYYEGDDYDYYDEEEFDRFEKENDACFYSFVAIMSVVTIGAIFFTAKFIMYPIVKKLAGTFS